MYALPSRFGRLIGEAIEGLRNLLFMAGHEVRPERHANVGGDEMKENIRILLVEDEEDDVLMALDAFKKGRITNEVDVVSNGDEAMQYLRHQGKFKEQKPPKPDLIFLDLRMRVMNGFEVLEEMQKEPELARIPVIVLTGLESNMDIKRACEGGARDYVNKPIDTLDLFKALLSIKELGFEIVKPMVK
jgi:two-component system, chemotaxis family, response regulator Rcp1